MNAEQLLRDHADLWRAATHSPFLDGIRSGELPEATFSTWLVQDYRFVAQSLRAQALLVAQAPRRDQGLLSQGVATLAAELDWFEAHLRSRGLDLATPMLPTCRAYGDYLLVMARAPYPSALTVAWTAERAYLDSWKGAEPASPAYHDFVERWTSDLFEEYVQGLARAVDQAFARASEDEVREAEEAFIWTARYERAFWAMAAGG